MFCSNCGKEIPEGSKFCPGCGKAADGTSNAASDPAKILKEGEFSQKLGANEALCWSCDKVVVKSATVCPHCGQKFPGMSLAMARIHYGTHAFKGIVLLVGTIILRSLLGNNLYGFGAVFNIFAGIGIVGGILWAIIGILGIINFTQKMKMKEQESQDAGAPTGQ
jgi:RNA polymerase subunit RPABC4/transcription elongation factor Spt4